MIKLPHLSLLSVTALAAALTSGCATIEDIPEQRVGVANLAFANGLPAGTAQLFAHGDEVTLGVLATGLAPGEHGFHLHTTGRCEGPDFKSAGGHLNPANRTHGRLSPGGKHLGDMPNLVVDSSRSARATVELDGDRATVIDTIFDGDGTAVVIHAGPDDYRTDPAGDAGARLACGIMRRPS